MNERENDKEEKMFIQVEKILNLSKDEFGSLVHLLIERKGGKLEEILYQIYQERRS